MRIAQLANFYAPTSGGLRVAVDRLREGYQAAGDATTAAIAAEQFIEDQAFKARG